MLTKVEVFTAHGQTLVLPLEYSNNGYLIQDIEGLDPVKAVVVSSNFAGQDGEQYQTSRREARNIVFKLELKRGAAESVRDLRTRLYSIFSPKSTIRLRFHDDEDGMVDISGVVESCFAPLFVQEPVATISVLCHKPDFYVPTPKFVAGSTVSDSTEIMINYTGSIETGIKFLLDITQDMSEFTIYHRLPDNSLRSLEFNEPLLAGDKLEINTNAGEKSAVLIRAGSHSSVLYGIAPVSHFITLFPGTNYIRVYSEAIPSPFVIEYTDKVGGL